MLPGEAIPRAPSLHRGGRHQAHRPRLERGDAPARGTRRGSTEGMAPWRHLTAGLNPAALVPGRLRSPQAHQTADLEPGGNTRSGRTRWRAPRCRAGGANHLGGTRCASSEWARPATVVRWATTRSLSRRTLTRAVGRQTRTEAGASRGGGFTARGRARASNMRCRDR